jgi:hypothetical protein
MAMVIHEHPEHMALVPVLGGLKLEVRNHEDEEDG